MKRFISLFLLFVLIFGLCSCSSKTPATAEDIYYALEAAGFPVHSLTVVTEETDSNELLGRPGQYTSKVIFFDISGNATSNSDECTIEVFESKEDAEERYEYVKALSESIAMLSEYDYLNGIALLRIDNCVIPDEAQKYEEWFMAQDFSDFIVSSTKTSNGEATQQSTDYSFTEPTGDTVKITIPDYLLSEEQIEFLIESSNSVSTEPGEPTVTIDENIFILTMSKEMYDENLSKSSIITNLIKNLSNCSSFKNIEMSDDFLMANVTVDKTEYTTLEHYTIIKKLYSSMSSRNASFGNYEPNITINMIGQGETEPFYVFRHKRPSERIYELTVDEITQAFSKDEASARKEYIGKYVEITGKFRTVENTGTKTYTLIESIENPDNPIWVQGNINLDYCADTNTLQKGDEITIIGKCVGYDYFVIVDDCVFF